MLKQEVEERSLPVWHTPPQSMPVPQSRAVPAILSRADVEQVLQVAARLQSAEQDKLSVADIEALAAQRGISSHHVRQALAMNHPQDTLTISLTPVRLTTAQWKISSLVVLFYWLFMTVFPLYVPSVVALIVVLPLLLSAALGWFLRYKRAGAMAGAALLFATLLSFTLLTAVEQGTGAALQILSLGMFNPIVVYMAIGIVGAALRQWITDHQPPYLPTVVKTAKSDR